MADVVGRIVRSFKGLDYGQYNTGNHASTVRRPLDTPRELLNMMHTDDGHLWMPPAPSQYVTNVSGTGDLYFIRQSARPTGTLIVQKGTTVNVYDVSTDTIPVTSADATQVLAGDQKIWMVVYDSTLYFGNSQETFKLTSGPTITDITGAGIPDGYHSMMYRNRRFVMQRGNVAGTSGLNRLWYSDIGDPETFGANAYIEIGGYFAGDSWDTALGSPVALHPYGDVLTLFLSQGVVRFTGTDPTTNFTLRPSLSTVGAWFRDSLSEIESGVIYFGGTPRGEFGFYLWSGNSSRLISSPLDGYLRKWVENDNQQFSENLAEAVTWRNFYIAAVDVNADPTIFVYNWRLDSWSTFNGWTRPTISISRSGADDGTDRFVIADSDDTVVYNTTSPMCRATATTTARFRVGYEDEEQPSGLVRFQKVRMTVNAKAAGGSGIEVCLTASVDGSSGTSMDYGTTITTDGQHTIDFPIKMRGSSIDLDFSIIPSASDHEMVVENLELVQSRKSLKVARIGSVAELAVQGYCTDVVVANGYSVSLTSEIGTYNLTDDTDELVDTSASGEGAQSMVTVGDYVYFGDEQGLIHRIDLDTLDFSAKELMFTFSNTGSGSDNDTVASMATDGTTIVALANDPTTATNGSSQWATSSDGGENWTQGSNVAAISDGGGTDGADQVVYLDGVWWRWADGTRSVQVSSNASSWSTIEAEEVGSTRVRAWAWSGLTDGILTTMESNGTVYTTSDSGVTWTAPTNNSSGTDFHYVFVDRRGNLYAVDADAGVVAKVVSGALEDQATGLVMSDELLGGDRWRWWDNGYILVAKVGGGLLLSDDDGDTWRVESLSSLSQGVDFVTGRGEEFSG